MPIQTRPEFNVLWGQNGSTENPGNDKIAQGWIEEIPECEVQNFYQLRADQSIAHILQAGISVWNSTTSYTANKSYVQASDGNIYVATADSVGQNPINTTSWRRLIRYDVPTVAQDRQILTGTGLQGGGNLSADRTLALSPSGVTAGTYGSSGSVSRITVDSLGRITSASNQAIDFSSYTTKNTPASGVGSYILARSFTTVTMGNTVAGSQLRDVRIRQQYVDASGEGSSNDMAMKAYAQGSGFSGTWRLMGGTVEGSTSGAESQYFDVGLFLRIA